MTLERVPDAGVARWIHTARPAAELAERIADTEFVPRALRGNAPAVAACIMYGDEIGVGPMTALAGIHVIDGRPFLSAELMRALVLGAGHRIRVAESTGTRCVVIGWRREDVPYSDAQGVRVEWTIEMARAAGLAGRGAWRTYPRALLLARASADLCRSAFADVVRGLGHIPESPDAEHVADWNEYAGSLGPEPDAPAPAPTETVQWNPRPVDAAYPAAGAVPDTSGEAPGNPVPANASPDPNPVPWDDDTAPETTAEAGKSAPTASAVPPGLTDDEAIGAPPVVYRDPETPAEREAFLRTAKRPTKPVEAEDPATRPPDDQLIRRIMAAYGDLPFGPDRATRLSVFSAIVGRPLSSTKDLDRMSGYRVLGGLKSLLTGETVAVDDGHGNISIHAGTEPPDDDD